MNTDEDIKPDEVKPDEQQPFTPESTPPVIPDEQEVEKEWAEKLHMDYDPEQVKANREAQTPPPTPPYGGGPRPYFGQQPAPSQPWQNRQMPPTYMIWAVISTICCCLPAGVVAIFFAAQVSTKFYARDFEGAERASRRAEIWIIASIVLGIIGNAIYIPLSFLTSGI